MTGVDLAPNLLARTSIPLDSPRQRVPPAHGHFQRIVEQRRELCLEEHHDRRDKRWGSDPGLGVAVGDPKRTMGFLRELGRLVLFRLNVIEPA